MLASEILRSLPSSADWMVLFSLSAIRPFVADDVIRSMFSVPADCDLARFSHMVLSSLGPFLAPANAGELLSLGSSPISEPAGARASAYDRFQEQLALVAVDDADCVGVGQSAPYPPVLLHIRIDSGFGHAQAVFDRKPSQDHYELLPAIGVEFLGGEQKVGHYLAHYRNRLPAHVLAGQLAYFSRTEHCNLFFLRHGNIDDQLEAGLAQSADNRVAYARAQAVRAVALLADEVCAGRAGLTCFDPLSATRFLFGDIVPLGFMLRALRSFAADMPELARHPIFGTIEGFLTARRQGSLWSYHSGGLVTATDSALVLQGFDDRSAIEALERFNNGSGAYYPQLCSGGKEAGKMLANERNQHWCQPDYATTCMIRGLRRAVGLQVLTNNKMLADGFATRSGLYFANPYMVDWTLATAIAGAPATDPLLKALKEEILASMNPDYSFGLYDVPLSTAFAILSLALLGVRGRLLRAVQLRLLETQDTQGNFPAAIPFYSAEAMMPQPSAQPAGPAQMVRVGGKTYGVSLYADSFGLITTAVSALALSVDGQAPTNNGPLILPRLARPHERYRCPTLLDYVQSFALPPYLPS
jgi:hypothetical protein